MDKRIFGLANDYSVTRDFHGQPGQSLGEVTRGLFREVAAGRDSDVRLRNGARLNLQATSRPQYATPECDSVPDLIAHDKAGERILEDLAAAAERQLRDAGMDGTVCVFKASADPADNSSRSREKYLVSRQGEFGRLAGALVPFLVTRQVICGAGKVLQTPRGAVYALSRGPGQVPAGASPARIRSRPIINTRDEPDAAAHGFRRLHVAVSEPNMSETTVLLKLGATDLVLRMFEAGVVLPDLILDNAVGAIQAVSLDITARRPLRLANGREMRALDIQREYLARARDFTQRIATDERVLGLWERVLDSVETGHLDAIARQVDWAAKYLLIERYRAAHGLPLSAAQVAELDLAYHDVNRGRGGYYLLQRGGGVERAVRDIDIFEAKTMPPVRGRYRQAG
jgi:proteasome accessory factor A